MPTITLRIKFEPKGHIGHGKIELLEQIAAFGSISAGARKMNMSYKRAWDLVEETARLAGAPVVETRSGGAQGGGARLTETGERLLVTFRAIERAAAEAAAPLIAGLARPTT